MRIRFADMELDAQRFLLWRSGERVALRPKVFDLLIHLARNRERVVSRDELVRLLWGNTVVGAGSLSGLINELRVALGERGNSNSSIRTVHARGYQFIAEVRAVIGDEPGPQVEASATFEEPDPVIPTELLDELRLRLVCFMRDEIRPIVESEGFGPLLATVLETLFRDPAMYQRRSGHEVARPLDESLGSSTTSPRRRMRVTRSTSPEARRGAG